MTKYSSSERVLDEISSVMEESIPPSRIRGVPLIDTISFSIVTVSFGRPIMRFTTFSPFLRMITISLRFGKTCSSRYSIGIISPSFKVGFILAPATCIVLVLTTALYAKKQKNETARTSTPVLTRLINQLCQLRQIHSRNEQRKLFHCQKRRQHQVLREQQYTLPM